MDSIFSHANPCSSFNSIAASIADFVCTSSVYLFRIHFSIRLKSSFLQSKFSFILYTSPNPLGPSNNSMGPVMPCFAMPTMLRHPMATRDDAHPLHSDVYEDL